MCNQKECGEYSVISKYKKPPIRWSIVGTCNCARVVTLTVNLGPLTRIPKFKLLAEIWDTYLSPLKGFFTNSSAQGLKFEHRLDSNK